MKTPNAPTAKELANKANSALRFLSATGEMEWIHWRR